MKDIIFGKLKAVVPPFFAFIIITIIYFFPVINGKELLQNDVLQAVSALQESKIYMANGDEEVLWSNSSFSGMPVWRGKIGTIIYTLTDILHKSIPSPIFIAIVGYISFFILAMALGSSPWVAFALAVAFVFSSFNIVSLEAGHLNKILNMMLMPALIAGFIWSIEKKYFKGFLILLVSSSFFLYYGHYQIVYYEIIILFGLAVYYLIEQYKAAQIKSYLLVIVLTIVVGAIALGLNIVKLWDTQVYSKSSTRGGSELANESKEKAGLDKEYVMDWSNGNLEVFTSVIPYFYGGSSTEQLNQNSTFYKALLENNVPRDQAKEIIKNVPLYWGDQPFTSGPVYFGATIFFLFVLAFFIVKNNIKWWILGLTILAFLLSMGKNIEWLSDFTFHYLPLYNKFRSVTMIMAIAQLTFPWLAVYAVNTIVQKQLSYNEFWEAFKKTFMICGGILLAFALLGGMMFDFSSDNDIAQFKDYPNWFLDALIDERKSKFMTDSIRSLFFVIALAALVWALMKEKINQTIFYVIFSLLVIIDLIGVDWRYLNHKSFTSKVSIDETLKQKSQIDERLLADSSYYRVFNLTKSPFNDAITSYHHKSIGGYSAIKLSRYQDLIERHLRENIGAIYESASGKTDSIFGRMNAYNMLNTKYVIIPQQNQEPFLWTNPLAKGNAWFVSSFQLASGANDEITKLGQININKEVVVDKKYENELINNNLKEDSTAQIILTKYHPDKLSYKSKSATNAIAVFSEIYYQPGWNAYLDGKLSPHFRANYTLRAMLVPSGEHTIEFKFEPEHHITGLKISKIFSFIFILAVAVCIGGMIWQGKK